MSSNPTDLTYRRTAIEGASGVGLMISLYDTLAGDLRRAADALRSKDIEKRCKELSHALLVVGFLETLIDRKNGGALAQNLSALYTNLQAKMIEAQAKMSAEILDQQVALVIGVRGTWQKLESSVSTAAAEVATPAQAKEPRNAFESQEQRSTTAWSA